MYIPNLNPEDDVSLEIQQQINYGYKLEQARGLFRLNCTSTNRDKLLDDINQDKWTLNDYVLKAESIARQIRDILEDVYALSLQEMQSLRSKDTDKELFNILKNWRIWQRFVISFKPYVV